MELNELTEDRQAGSAISPLPADASAPTGWLRVIGVGLGLAVLVGLLVTAFAWPPAESAPRNVPIAIVGPAEATARLEQQLATSMPDAFKPERAADTDAARQLIQDREVYGAIVLEPAEPPQVLTASAGSPVISQILNGIADQLAQQAAGAPSPQVEDVVPLSADDPRGSVFAAAALPMVIGGMVVGILLSFVVAGVWRRVAGALVAALTAGWVVTLVTHGWLGALDGSPWANAGAVALTIAAISLTMIGLVSLLGPVGIGLGAVIMFLVGNSLSGVSSAPEMLPTGWATFGQMLPAGAGGALLRSTAYFDGAAAARPVLVLTAWVAAGLVLAALGRRLRPASRHALAD
ncbi:MAG TPA: ABC transporter permease [Jiangellaceae bacterium]|nr:ABC transporter permease [Jiangellaceae bacterium]